MWRLEEAEQSFPHSTTQREEQDNFAWIVERDSLLGEGPVVSQCHGRVSILV